MKKAAGAAVIALLLCSIIPYSLDTGIQTVTAASSDQWTFAIIMDGDNSLSYQVDNDLAEIQASNFASSSDVNVAVLADKSSLLDSKIYTFSDGGFTTLSPLTAGLLYEVNMGSESQLWKFIDWTFGRYPADKYGVVFWDHGSGWVVLCQDATNNDWLSITELGSLLNTTAAKYGRVDLVGFDACLMANLETLYQIRGDCEYVVASEHLEPFRGWDYTGWLNAVFASSTMNASTVGYHICETYNASCSEEYATLAAIDMRVLDVAFSGTFNTGIERVRQEANSVNVSARLQGTRVVYGKIGFTLYDLHDFCGEMWLNASQDLFASLVVHRVAKDGSLRGINVYVPDSEADMLSGYGSTDLAVWTSFDDFIREYHRASTAPPPVSAPTYYVSNGTLYVLGNNTQVKIDRGQWYSGNFSVAAANHTFYMRNLNDTVYSPELNATYSNVTRVVCAGNGVQVITLDYGWNLIGFTVEVSYTAREFVALTGCLSVAGFDRSWTYYSSGISQLNSSFGLDSSEAFFAYYNRNDSKMVRFEGAPVLSKTYNLDAGWNPVVWRGGDTTLKALAEGHGLRTVGIYQGGGWSRYSTSAGEGGSEAVLEGSTVIVYSTTEKTITVT